MKDYKDVHGKYISVGDVIVYDDGVFCGQSIDEVVDHNGELALLMRIGYPRWTAFENEQPILLKYCSAIDGVVINAAIADVPHEEAFTAEFAESQFGA